MSNDLTVTIDIKVKVNQKLEISDKVSDNISLMSELTSDDVLDCIKENKTGYLEMNDQTRLKMNAIKK